MPDPSFQPSASSFSAPAPRPAWGVPNCCCRGAIPPLSGISCGNGANWAQARLPSSTGQTTRPCARNWTGWMCRHRTVLKTHGRSAGCSVPSFARPTGRAGKRKSQSGLSCWEINRICGRKPCVHQRHAPRKIRMQSVSRNSAATCVIRFSCRAGLSNNCSGRGPKL